MATNWPTSRDTFTNPTSGDTLDSPSHAAQHANINDAVEAMQAHAGLVLVKPTSAVNGTVGANGAVTIGSGVSSVTVTDAFSSTFENYLVVTSVDATSAGGPYLTLALDGSTTGYYYGAVLSRYSDANVVGTNTNNGSSWDRLGPLLSTSGGAHSHRILRPNIAKTTMIESFYVDPSTGGRGGAGGGFHNVSTAYTGLVVGVSSGTMTGGTIRVYGYNNG